MAEISLSEYAGRPKPAPQKRTPVPHIGFVVGGLVLAVISFLAGMQYQRGKAPTSPVAKVVSAQNDGNGSASSGGFSRGGFRRNRAFGTVSSVSSSSITIQTRSGSSATYTITNSTTVSSDGQPGNVSDIQSGDTVILTLDSSTTQDVTSILLNPSFSGGSGGFGGDPSGTSDTDPAGSTVPSGV